MEIMVVTGVMSIMSAGVARMISNMNTENKKIIIKTTAQSVLSLVESQMKSDHIWTATRNNAGNDGSAAVQNTESFYCFDEGTNCTTTPKHFILYSSSTEVNSNLSSDAADPDSRGFDYNGVPCSTYDVNGDDGCPFQLKLTYVPSCNNVASCTVGNSSITITAAITYSPASERLKVPMNSNGLKIVRSRGASTVATYPERICEHFRGRWDGSNCRLNTENVCRDLLGSWDANLNRCSTVQGSASLCTEVGGVWNHFGNNKCNFPGLIDMCKEMGGTPAQNGNFQFVCNGLSSTANSTTSVFKNLCIVMKGSFTDATATTASVCDTTNLYNNALTTTCTQNGGKIVVDASVYGGKFCVWDQNNLDLRLQDLCANLDNQISGLTVNNGSGVYDGTNCLFSVSHDADNIRQDTDVTTVYNAATAAPAPNAVGTARCSPGFHFNGFYNNGMPVCIQLPVTGPSGPQFSDCSASIVMLNRGMRDKDLAWVNTVVTGQESLLGWGGSKHVTLLNGQKYLLPITKHGLKVKILDYAGFVNANANYPGYLEYSNFLSTPRWMSSLVRLNVALPALTNITDSLTVHTCNNGTWEKTP